MNSDATDAADAERVKHHNYPKPKNNEHSQPKEHRSESKKHRSESKNHRSQSKNPRSQSNNHRSRKDKSGKEVQPDEYGDHKSRSRRHKSKVDGLAIYKNPLHIKEFRPLTLGRQLDICMYLGLDNAYAKYAPLEITRRYRLHPVIGDGNCYFRSISVALTGTELNHLALRTLVVNHMLTPPMYKSLSDYIGDKVLHYMQENFTYQPGAWATDAEIIATADLISQDIMIYCSYGTTPQGEVKYDWLRYSSILGKAFNNEAIYLRNMDDHFDVVEPC